MISVVLYGRNDNYGYNLHKRAALSLNCIAEVLSDPDDEILFVDYNTPDDFPTFPEAIHDTLTAAARERLRVFRVRPASHARYAARTHLKALEPIARNVAIRRSNPSNRWILSTNTDLVFVPRVAGSLTEIVADLPLRFYHAPRLEIPETLWEGLDRGRPGEVIDTIRRWGRSLHLDEVVRSEPRVLYDGPGDFQLIAREDLFAIQGFHEAMLLGWHVDSNIAIRLRKLHGQLGDLGDKIFGYHCDHTRQVTPAHSAQRIENDWRTYIDEVSSPDLPEFANAWGLAGEAIEEIRVNSQGFQGYVAALQTAIGAPLQEPYRVSYTKESFDLDSYEPRHSLPFLLDLASSAPRATRLAWWGRRPDALRALAVAWKGLAFSEPILVAGPEAATDTMEGSDVSLSRVDELIAFERADLLVFDFGRAKGGDPSEPGTSEREFVGIFLRAVLHERARIDRGGAPRRFVGVDVVNNRFESLFRWWVATGATPFSTRIRHGFVAPLPKGAQDWLPKLSVGEAGRREKGGIVSDERRQGMVAYGPYARLMQGAYRVNANFEFASRQTGRIVLEVMAGPKLIGAAGLDVVAQEASALSIDFAIDEAVATDPLSSIETRVRATTPCPFRILAMTAETLDPANVVLEDSSSREWDVLPMMTVGPRGAARTDGIGAASGKEGNVAYGPYWRLEKGTYRLDVDLACLDSRPQESKDCLFARFEAKMNGVTLGACVIRRGSASQIKHALTFRVPPEGGELEFPLETSGQVGLLLRAAKLRQTGEGAAGGQGFDWLPLVNVGPTAARAPDGIVVSPKTRGVFVHGPYWSLAPGRYALATAWRDVIAKDDGVLFGMEVVAEGEILATLALDRSKLLSGATMAAFAIDGDRPRNVEVRMRATGLGTGVLTSIACLPGGQAAPVIASDLGVDILPFQSVGEAGFWGRAGVSSRRGVSGNLVHGPYWPLKPGAYRLDIEIAPETPIAPGARSAGFGKALVMLGSQSVADFILDQTVLARQNREIQFTVPASTKQPPELEVLVSSNGAVGLRIGSLRLSKADRTRPNDAAKR